MLCVLFICRDHGERMDAYLCQHYQEQEQQQPQSGNGVVSVGIPIISGSGGRGGGGGHHHLTSFVLCLYVYPDLMSLWKSERLLERER
jgi:hypothetical protein